MTAAFVRVSDLGRDGVLKVEDGNHGEYRPRPHEFVDGGTPFIRAADMTSGEVDFRGAGKIDSTARLRIRKGVGLPGDVLLSHKGTVGKVAVAPRNAPDYVCSPQTTFWRSLDSTRLDQRYLRYVMQSPMFVAQLNVLKGQTDMAPYVSLTDQRSIMIPAPAVQEQRRIAEVLGALDDKIAADANLVSAVDALMATRMQAILNGAEGRPLSATAEFVNGKAFTRAASGTGRVVIRIAELNSGIGASTVFSDATVADQHLARPGDVLFAWSGSLTLSRWFRDEAIINQHIFKVIPRPGYPTWLVYGLIARKLDDFKATAANKATTMGHIQRHHLDEVVPVPEPERIANDDTVMSALWQRALSAERESLKLAAMRDALLPLLMSGKVRIKDAEKAVGDAV